MAQGLVGFFGFVTAMRGALEINPVNWEIVPHKIEGRGVFVIATYTLGGIIFPPSIMTPREARVLADILDTIQTTYGDLPSERFTALASTFRVAADAAEKLK